MIDDETLICFDRHHKIFSLLFQLNFQRDIFKLLRYSSEYVISHKFSVVITYFSVDLNK